MHFGGSLFGRGEAGSGSGSGSRSGPRSRFSLSLSLSLCLCLCLSLSLYLSPSLPLSLSTNDSTNGHMICDAVKVHAPRLANKRVEAQAIMCVPRLADFDWAHGCRHDLQESACQKYTNTEIGKHAKSLKSSPWSCCGADLSGLVCVCGSACLF